MLAIVCHNFFYIAHLTSFSPAFGLAAQPMLVAVRLKAEALTDPLTGLLNRRALSDVYDKFRFDGVSTVVLFDLDHFKRVNDRYGHDVGDRVLRAFAAIVTDQRGKGGHAFRLGGEEFALLLRRSTADEALQRVETIRQLFERHLTETELGPLQCTTSAGLCFGTSDGRSLSEVLKGADVALYKAKEAGRNRIVIFGEASGDDQTVIALRQAG